MGRSDSFRSQLCIIESRRILNGTSKKGEREAATKSVRPSDDCNENV